MNPSILKGKPDEDLGNPNDDGCVLGTAGRDEDPNQGADYHKPESDPKNVQTPEDAHGMPGYPSEPSEPEKIPSERIERRRH